MRNKEKGITLIALIITIIVMLILVGVVVTVVIQSNLLGTAKTAGDKYKTAYEDESNMSEVTINGEKYASIEDYINNNPMSSIKINMEVTHEDTAVTADGTNIKSIEHGAPIPVGYSYVTGEKNTGVVIQDDTTSDQFVWVPVLQNQKIKIEITAEEAITEIELLDPTGTQITTPAQSGKTYTASVEPTRNGVYKLTAKTANDVNEKIMYASTLYAQDAFATKEMFRSEVQYAMQQQNKTEAEILANLPGVGENPTIDTAYPIWANMRASRYTDNADTPEATVTLYKNSVNKYGGFYIARYEAGSANPRTSSSGTGDAVLSQANKYPYNYINQTDSITKAATMNNGKTNVTASLINSAVWDRTLNWLEETKAVTKVEIIEDSTNWGNYYNSQFEFIGKYSTNYENSFTDSTTSTPKPQDKGYLLGTGVSEYTKRNNIYDLAGNYWEWTTESDSSSGRVSRGGGCGSHGFEPAYCRDGDSADSSYNVVSFRSALYVNL